MADKIMIVRHGEKPSDDKSIHGVTEAGDHDPDELSVRGWQRSGALVRFFAPPDGQFANPHLAKPDVILASTTAGHIDSLRPQHTVLALAEFLGKQISAKYTKGQEKTLAD